MVAQDSDCHSPAAALARSVALTGRTRVGLVQEQTQPRSWRAVGAALDDADRLRRRFGSLDASDQRLDGDSDTDPRG